MATQEQIEMRKKWIAALRSDEFKQTDGVLFDGNGYCCLGVACKVAGREFEQSSDDDSYWIDDENCSLPRSVMDLFGLTTPAGDYTTKKGKEGCLVDLNDDAELSFKQIANIIEKAPPGLFVD